MESIPTSLTTRCLRRIRSGFSVAVIRMRHEKQLLTWINADSGDSLRLLGGVSCTGLPSLEWRLARGERVIQKRSLHPANQRASREQLGFVGARLQPFQKKSRAFGARDLKFSASLLLTCPSCLSSGPCDRDARRASRSAHLSGRGQRRCGRDEYPPDRETCLAYCWRSSCCRH